ncbi:SMP-30/gluconolactonase/LRE family protein [Roseibium sp.]|uniref:SMP-30/gluconolactonase/LRE family protein n=1 Tax=Roseibium sp. TaxID=1936156 RepID=UPI003A976E9E
MSEIYDNRRCQLGEGPLWHPLRKQLFWFDIIGMKLLSRVGDQELEWQFEEHVSAAGWIDTDRLLIASESRLFEFDVTTGAQRKICDLEADNPATRSNDGRADPRGGFWIGTMGKEAEQGAGSIYRYYKGELRQLFPDITISNAICFAPDGKTAYFADTDVQTIWSVELDGDGWPAGERKIFLDLSAEGINPDGAVVDRDGNFWNAQWGSHRIARYAPDGRFLDEIRFDAEQVSCPAFGGDDFATLFATTAAVNLTGNAQGLTYTAQTTAHGQAEHQVLV